MAAALLGRSSSGGQRRGVSGVAKGGRVTTRCAPSALVPVAYGEKLYYAWAIPVFVEWCEVGRLTRRSVSGA
jgi:hypothetical protein